jgi:hypothetical protein
MSDELLQAIWNQTKDMHRDLIGCMDRVRDDLIERMDRMRDDLVERMDRFDIRMDHLELETRALRTAMDAGFSQLARTDARQDRELDEHRVRLDALDGGKVKDN